MIGFSILYKSAKERTDNTLITILGKPTLCDSWQDNLINIIARQLYNQIPNHHRLTIINNEAPLVEKLRSIGLLTAIGTGSLQNLVGCGVSLKAQELARKQDRDPIDYVCSFLNQGLLFGLCEAEPFFDKATQKIKKQVSPIFTFDKDADSIGRWLYNTARNEIYIAMKPYENATGNYVIHKNAMIGKDYTNIPFKDDNYNNLVLIDNSHCDEAYTEQWHYLDPNDFTGFKVIATPEDISRQSLATTELLAELVRSYASNTFELYCE